MEIAVPGRTELAGNHTDHQGGRVLAAAVDLMIRGEAEPLGERRVLLRSRGFGEIAVDLDHLGREHSRPGTAEALVRGTLEYLEERGYHPQGFIAELHSDIPAGAGLSSSAAFSVWVGTALSRLYHGGSIPHLDLAMAARYGENVHFGKPCGLMDQCACTFGGVTAMDFYHDPPKVRRIPVSPDSMGYSLCVVQTGGDHRDLTEDFACITREMAAVSACFGEERLSRVREEAVREAVPALRRQVGDRAVLRALHYFEEDRRAAEMAAALERRDMDAYLAGMEESGRSSAELLQNTYSPAAVESQGIPLALALSRRALAGRGAARVHGGGFAGTIQALMPEELEEGYRRELERVFGAGSCRRLRVVPPASP